MAAPFTKEDNTNENSGKSIFRGMDWHDSYILTQYLTGKNGYDVSGEDCMDLIARDVEKLLKDNCPSWEAPTEKIRQCLDFTEPYGEIPNVIVRCKNGRVEVITDTCGFSHNVRYYIRDISDPVYAAVEEFYAPYKAVCTIQRTYWPLFGSYAEAEKALEKIPDRPEYLSTGKLVLIYDKSDFEPGKNAFYWLRANLRDVEIRKENPELPFVPAVILED